MPDPIVTISEVQFNGAVPFKLAQVTLTNADILALPTTPKVIVAAPGTGLRVEFIMGTVQVNTNAGAYTNVLASQCRLGFKTGGIPEAVSTYVFNDSTINLPTPSSSLSPTELTTFLATTGKRVNRLLAHSKTDAMTAGGWGLLSYNQTLANMVNQPLHLFIQNGASSSGGVLTGGNAANTMDVTALYAIVAGSSS